MSTGLIVQGISDASCAQVRWHLRDAGVNLCIWALFGCKTRERQRCAGPAAQSRPVPVAHGPGRQCVRRCAVRGAGQRPAWWCSGVGPLAPRAADCAPDRRAPPARPAEAACAPPAGPPTESGPQHSVWKLAGSGLRGSAGQCVRRCARRGPVAGWVSGDHFCVECWDVRGR